MTLNATRPKVLHLYVELLTVSPKFYFTAEFQIFKNKSLKLETQIFQKKIKGKFVTTIGRKIQDQFAKFWQ